MCHDCASERSRTLSQQFANRLLKCSRAPLSEAARRNAAVLLADFLACMRAGAGWPGCPATGWADFGKVLCAGKSLADVAGAADSSAAAASAAAHAMDRDDVHWDAVTHPGSVVWPVVLGFSAGATGPQLLAAAVAGYEACVRMARFLGPRHRRWFHSTATAGTVGATAAAAMLLCLDDEALANALGHAISVIGGSAQCLGEHSGTQVFHRSHAVRTGIAAARAAADGLPATRLGFEGATGLLAGPEPAVREREALVDDRPPAIGTTSVRLCAAAGWYQAAVQAAAAQPRSALRADSVAVHVHPTAADISSGPAVHGRDRWWSLEWSVATALVTGDPQVSPESPVGDEELRERLAQATVVVGDQPSLLTASVSVSAAEGKRVSTTTVNCPAGHYSNPASAEQLAAKWSRMQPAGRWATARALESICAEVLATTSGAAGRLSALLWSGDHGDHISSLREGWIS